MSYPFGLPEKTTAYRMENAVEAFGPAVVAINTESARIERSNACDAAIESVWNIAVAERLLPGGKLPAGAALEVSVHNPSGRAHKQRDLSKEAETKSHP